MTTLISLKDILDKQWAKAFERLFLRPETLGKRQLLDELTAVNGVRNYSGGATRLSVVVSVIDREPSWLVEMVLRPSW